MFPACRVAVKTIAKAGMGQVQVARGDGDAVD